MSLHQKNLKTIAFIKEFETVYLENNTILINKSYFQKFQNDYPLSKIIDIYKISFNHYLILLNLPKFNLSQSSNSLNDFLDYEYRNYILTFLKKSLDGLERMSKYYIYYRYKDDIILLNSILKYYTKILSKFQNELENIKNGLSSPSPEINQHITNFLNELEQEQHLLSQEKQFDQEEKQFDQEEKQFEQEEEKQFEQEEKQFEQEEEKQFEQEEEKQEEEEEKQEEEEEKQEEEEEKQQLEEHNDNGLELKLKNPKNEQGTTKRLTLWDRIKNRLNLMKNGFYVFCRRCINILTTIF